MRFRTPSAAWPESRYRHPRRSRPRLGDDRAEVRACAARGLALLGDTSDEVLALLARSVSDPSPYVRRQTVEILAQTRQSRHGEIVAALARAVDDADDSVALAAFEALLEIGQFDDAALRKSAQDRPSEAVRRRAAEVIRDQEEAAVAIKKAAEDNRLEEIRRRAADAMRVQEEKMARMRIEPLLERMRGMDDRQGYAAAETLAKRQAIPVLLELLAGNNARGRERAAFALGHMGAQGREAVPELLKLLPAKELPVRRRAAEAIAHIVPATDKETTAALLAALKEDDVEIRVHLTEALGKLGRAAVMPLSEALADPDVRVRRGAAEALANLDPKAKRALPALREALRDADPGVRKAAQEAITNIERD